MQIVWKRIKKPLLLTLCLLLLCGIAYPLFITGISQLLFPQQANGSILYSHGEAVGSQLVGQDFTDARFMKCRPSAVNYNTYTEEEKAEGMYPGLASGSSNYGPSDPKLVARVEKDLAEFLRANPSISRQEIPADLMTASASGLDPHISPAAAAVQIPALAEATGLSTQRLNEIVGENTQGKLLGLFGEETVNVLKVNLQIAKDLQLL